MRIHRTVPQTTDRTGSERGSALVPTVVLLGTLMVLSAAFLRIEVGLSHENNSAYDDSRAFYVAEAGISEAAAAIVAGHSGNVGSQALPATYGDGLVWVAATNLGNGDYQLDSTALCGGGRAALRSVVHATVAPDTGRAIFSDLPLAIGSNFLLDSYDPAKGSYASQPKVTYPGKSDKIVAANGRVASNHGIALSSNDRIYGNAAPGPGFSVTGLGGNTFVTGSTAPASSPVVLPPVVVPPIASLGAKSVKKTDSLALRTLNPGNYHFSSLTLGNSAAFTIKGPATVVLDSLVSNSGCALNIDATGGPVQIYCTGSASFVSNMTVTSTAPSAKSVTMNFIGSTPVSLNSNATYLGTIYAPVAPLLVSANWVNYGSITGKQIALASNVNLHYDESLSPKAKSALTSLALRQWERRPVPQELIHKRVSPYVLLGLKPGSLPQSSNAYQ